MIAWTKTQTVGDAYREICEGKDPWVALGNFTNDFYEQPELRENLVQDAVMIADDATHEQRQWAVFCAASVEFLCNKYAVSVPEWVMAEAFGALEEAWYFAPRAALKHEKVRKYYEEGSPSEFKRRLIYCGNRVYVNKHEEAANFLAKQVLQKTA